MESLLRNHVDDGAGLGEARSSRAELSAEEAALRVLEYRGRLDIVGHLAQQVLVDAESAAQPAFTGCQAGIGQGCITENGTVFPCVPLPVPVANVRERPFAQIWREAPGCSSVTSASLAHIAANESLRRKKIELVQPRSSSFSSSPHTVPVRAHALMRDHRN